jgi:hypothetical protein
MSLVALGLRIGLGLVVALVAGAGIAYSTDYGLEATVVGKDCGSSGGNGGGQVLPLADPEAQAAPSVTVKTKIGGLRHTQGLAPQYCQAVQQGNFVIYHIRSGRTTLYETDGGRCIYDSGSGLANCPT